MWVGREIRGSASVERERGGRGASTSAKAIVASVASTYSVAVTCKHGMPFVLVRRVFTKETKDKKAMRVRPSRGNNLFLPFPFSPSTLACISVRNVD